MMNAALPFVVELSRKRDAAVSSNLTAASAFVFE
jgi:hypothetical protein